MIADRTSQDPKYLPTTVGTDFVSTFYRLLKGASIYDRKYVLMDRLTGECLQVINGILQPEGHLFLKIVRDNISFNNIKIYVKADHYSICKGFLQEMRKRRIGELEFTNRVTGEHLQDFIYLLSGLEENNESNYLYMKKQMEYRGIVNIDVGKSESFKDEEISGNPTRYSKQAYFKSIHLVKEVLENIKNQKAIDIRKAKRIMQNAVNAVLQDESTLLGLANIKNYDEYIFNHSVNVAIYSIAIGQRVGIPKKSLSHLGMAALFHDIGRFKIPEDLLDKSGKLSPEEWEVIRSHPLIGAETVMRMKEWGDLSSRMMDGAFDHHIKYDLTGYPKLTQRKRLSLLSRIITLADFYDAFVRPRVSNRFPYISEKILGIMLEKSGKDFDPALTKVFVNLIGVFPIGTLALLNTNEMGIVTQIQEDTELIDRPKVNLLYYRDGEYRKGKIVDLREMDEKTGEFKWGIMKTLDPNDYNINIAEYLM